MIKHSASILTSQCSRVSGIISVPSYNAENYNEVQRETREENRLTEQPYEETERTRLNLRWRDVG